MSKAVRDTICERIAQGESLRSICESEGMPAARTVHRWLLDDADFCQQYARAREDQADHYADEIVSIADESPGLITREDGDEVEVSVDSAAVARQRLRIDARKWVASKLKPKKYGEKLDLEHSGMVGLAQVSAETLPPEEWERLYGGG